MIIVNKRQVDLDGNQLVGEASTMGLGVGEWPDFISVVDDAGNGFLFNRGATFNATSDDSEFGGYHYYTRGGQHLIVYND